MKATPTARVTRESRRMSRVTWGVTFAVSHGTPTRPDPTRPVLKAGGYVCMHRYFPTAHVTRRMHGGCFA